MTVEEIYADLAKRMIRGMMFHDQLVQYYLFLNLSGYAKCHEYHYLCESKCYRALVYYYLKHHNKLIKETTFEDVSVIPTSWHGYERREVDATTKRNAVKSGMEKWVAWEKETKAAYEKMYKELLDLGEIADADFISCLICDVDNELSHAESGYIKLKTLDFGIEAIMSCQHDKKRKYERKIEEEC